MKRAVSLLAAIVALAVIVVQPVQAQQPACRFVLGFADLRAAITAAIMGDCLEDEQHNPENGDATQRTTKGLAVWRKASNTMAFTDGATSWVMGPNGVQKRPNTHRFRWEPDGPMLNGGTGADPNAPVEMTPEIIRITNANRQAAGLPPLGSPAPAAAASPSPQAAAPPTTAPAVVKPTAPTPTATPAPSSAPSSAGPIGPRDPNAGVAPSSRTDCPSSHPIKGNQGSREDEDWVYHTRQSRSYAATQPERCFATEADARAAGYRPPEN